MQKLFNNNHTEYFFLNDCQEVGLTEKSVAILRPSISFKANLHYTTILQAKRLQLSAEFKAKLGWLMGNLFSRVGTQDWVPTIFAKEEEFRSEVNDILFEQVNFVKNLTEITKKLKNKLNPQELQSLDIDAFWEQVKTLQIPTRKELVLNRVTEILTSQVDSVLSNDQIKSIMRQITSSPEIKQL